MVREIESTELNDLLALYTHLHENGVPEMSEHLTQTWKAIMQDRNHHIIVNIVDGRMVSSCVCVIIPNLTRGIRPYALIENVVTHSDYRGMGHATACLDFARDIAVKADCYKIMLLTGSREASTLRFYERAGYNGTEKTAFIQRLE
jgi:GNAT superfamily N-acetyltransferase